MKQKLVIIGETTDEHYLSLKQLAEERYPTQTYPVKEERDKLAQPSAQQPLKNGLADKKEKRTRTVVSGTNTVECLLKYLAGRPFHKATRDEIEIEFANIGYKSRSVGGAISIAKREGWVSVSGRVVTGVKLPSVDETRAAIARTHDLGQLQKNQH